VLASPEIIPTAQALITSFAGKSGITNIPKIPSAPPTTPTITGM
jgi:hypothetical protein